MPGLAAGAEDAFATILRLKLWLNTNGVNTELEVSAKRHVQVVARLSAPPSDTTDRRVFTLKAIEYMLKKENKESGAKELSALWPGSSNLADQYGGKVFRLIVKLPPRAEDPGVIKTLLRKQLQIGEMSVYWWVLLLLWLVSNLELGHTAVAQVVPAIWQTLFREPFHLLYRNGPSAQLLGGLHVGFWAGKPDSQICAAMANSQELNEAYWQNQPDHCSNMIRRNEESIRSLIETMWAVYFIVLPLLTAVRTAFFGQNWQGLPQQQGGSRKQQNQSAKGGQMTVCPKGCGKSMSNDQIANHVSNQCPNHRR